MKYNRRTAMRMLTTGAAGAVLAPVLTARANQPHVDATQTSPVIPSGDWEYTLPDLPYSYDALEPVIDTRTMEIHHARHHLAYVNNLNGALAQHPELQERRLEDLLANLEEVPADIRRTVRNNGGGHWNHSFFWQIMSPDGGGEPTGDLRTEIDARFGSFSDFQAAFKDAATGVFGSGWAWLIVDGGGALQIEQTPNQDTPVMDGHHPVLGIDVWEHAYYLQYQNRRAEYVDRFWEVVDWERCAEHFHHARG